MSGSIERQVNSVWFREPNDPSDTYADRGEGLWEWLRRSTVQRAIESRRFLNSNLAQLPQAYADSLYARSEHSWRAAFFELVVARTFQAIGARVEIEPSSASGSKPDFKVEFPSGTLIIEATAPVFAPELQRKMGNNDHLLSFIESITPSGWSVFARKLPILGPADSKKEFKKVVADLLDIPPPQSAEFMTVSGRVGGQRIELMLIPRKNRKSTRAGGPVYSFWGGPGVKHIRTAVRRKRPQVRALDYPVVLAINASELVTEFSDFDKALFGDDQSGGVFSPLGEKSPTYAGVLAFIEASFSCSREPIFFLHPRFRCELPVELNRFQWRTLSPGQGISVIPASGKPVLEALGPVRV